MNSIEQRKEAYRARLLAAGFRKPLGSTKDVLMGREVGVPGIVWYGFGARKLRVTVKVWPNLRYLDGSQVAPVVHADYTCAYPYA